MSPDFDLDFAPDQIQVGVMSLLFGDLPHPIDEIESAPEVF